MLTASQYGDTGVVKRLLAGGANIEARTQNGETPLILAGRYGHADTVQLLLDKGADVKAQTKEAIPL
ncbi:MAG: ankyrin repeat domain-containing protein [Oligoflexia bacterium]|nr:ankyrin repeat domain-containing protein [Oligoflexia bacterium]